MVNDIHFWGNKYNRPEEYVIRVISFFPNCVNYLPEKVHFLWGMEWVVGGGGCCAAAPCPRSSCVYGQRKIKTIGHTTTFDNLIFSC